MRQRGAWLGKSETYLGTVDEILSELRSYWPLTLRQVYYQLVSRLVIENNKNEYKKLSYILTKARLDGKMPWEAIEDRTRSMSGGGGWIDAKRFELASVQGFLSGYARDLLQSQKTALEIWLEKDALSKVCQRAANPFGVPVVVAKGFSSITYVNRCRNRVEASLREGKRTRILYFGDLDPSGWFMLPCMMETLQAEMKLGRSVEGIRCALTKEQVAKHRLPRNPDAFKPKDSRAAAYRRIHGTLAVELDALRPDVLEKIVTDAIRRNLDLSEFKREKEREAEDLRYLDGQRSRVMALIEGREERERRVKPKPGNGPTPVEWFC